MTQNKSKKENNRWHILIYIAVAAFCFFIAFQTPYAHDDWDWGTSFGMNNFLNATQNSRYVGNFFALILTRSEILKTLVMGSVFFLIPFSLTILAEKVMDKSLSVKRHTLFVLCNCLVLSMSRSLFRQTYAWVSGFANYTVSALLMVFWINEILAVSDTQPLKKEPFYVTAICFFTALCTQLFLENITVFCLLCSVVLCIAYYKKHKKIPAKIIAMFLACVIGAAVMFSSSVYITLLQSGSAVNDYRQIPVFAGNGLTELAYKTLKTMMHLCIRLYSLNIVLTVCVLLIFTALLFKANHKSKKLRLLFIFSNSALVIAFIFCYIYDQICTTHLELIYYFDFLISLAYFASILFQVTFLFENRIKKQLLSLWTSAPLVIAPLIVTSEIGHRLFITPNIFITLFALISFCCLSKHISLKAIRCIQAAGYIFLSALLCFYCFIYINNGTHKNLREDIIKNSLQTNETSISLPPYPYGEYLYYPNGGALYLESFKEFYNIPENVEVIFEEKQQP